MISQTLTLTRAFLIGAMCVCTTEGTLRLITNQVRAELGG